MPSADAAVELRRQVEPVDRVDQGEASDCVARLVALERADEVPVDTHVGERFLLLQRFLDPVLPDVRQPGSHRGPDRFRAVGLGDRDDPHRMGPAADGLVRRHGLADPGETAGEGREVHSLGIYLGLGRSCRGPAAESGRPVAESATVCRAAWRSGLGESATAIFIARCIRSSSPRPAWA